VNLLGDGSVRRDGRRGRQGGIGIIVRLSSTSRNAIVRRDHGSLGFAASFSCGLWVCGSSNAGPNAAGRESDRRFRRRSIADVDESWPGLWYGGWQKERGAVFWWDDDGWRESRAKTQRDVANTPPASSLWPTGKMKPHVQSPHCAPLFFGSLVSALAVALAPRKARQSALGSRRECWPARFREDHGVSRAYRKERHDVASNIHTPPPQ
jgi:hypothetical protein